MKHQINEIYKKFIEISQGVQSDLRKQGIIIPSNNKDGSINVGNYRIVKNQDGMFQISDHKGRVVLDNINLPQTAVIMANDLALGKFLDRYVLAQDQIYGYALFEDQLHRRAIQKGKNKSLDHYELMLTKSMINRAKRDNSRREVQLRFEKLTRIL
jgi:hypothetical protein